MTGLVNMMKRRGITNVSLVLLFLCFFPKHSVSVAGEDLKAALRRAQYLLNASVPSDAQFSASASNKAGYQSAVRGFVNSDQFYNVLLRYHERLLGVGLPTDYMQELLRDNINNKSSKFAIINCGRTGADGRYRCEWASNSDDSSNSGTCPTSWERPASVFWYPGISAWVCPSVLKSCGPDLSRCFVEYSNQDEAKNSELGATESFDSKFAVIKSLSRQSAGLATAVAFQNYPYTKILEPGITAVDGAIAHFYRQNHHFKIDELNLPSALLTIIKNISLTDTRFRLINTGSAYETAGILTTFGFLRRYEKNRTRANQLYERLFCRKFTADLPRVFPQDPGNLRTAAGCSGCHATLDPLADFFKVWGEGGEFYAGRGSAIDTTFNGKSGKYVSDLARIIQNDQAFATCQVQNAWQWLMGRKFYHEEAELRAAFTNYFINTTFSFKELVYAIATHPAFLEGARGDGTVTDPLEDPPLGTVVGTVDRPCTTTISYANDIAPNISLCTNCHNSSSSPRQDLSTQTQWQQWGSQAVNMMASGSMPPGRSDSSVTNLKEAVRCWLEQN